MFTDRWVLLACATVMFLLGLVMCTNGGMYVLQLIDTYAATFSALIIGMAEVCVISWHYGIDRFLDDIKMMLGHDAPPRWYWRFVWKFFTPIIIVVSYFWNLFIAINLLIIGTFDIGHLDFHFGRLQNAYLRQLYISYGSYYSGIFHCLIVCGNGSHRGDLQDFPTRRSHCRGIFNRYLCCWVG